MHPADIVACVKKRGLTLKEVEMAHGLSKGALSIATKRPFPAAERALSQCTGKPLYELFPDRYRDDGTGKSVRITERRTYSTATRRRHSRNGEAR